jgi:hypothetical protein
MVYMEVMIPASSMRVCKRRRTQISERAVEELIRIVSIFSCCGASNYNLMEECNKDTSRCSNPFIDDGTSVAAYWSFRDSSHCVELNLGSFATRDCAEIQSMISAYTQHTGDAAQAPFRRQMSGLKLVWQLSQNPNAMTTMRISDELVNLAQRAFVKMPVICIE